MPRLFRAAAVCALTTVVALPVAVGVGDTGISIAGTQVSVQSNHERGKKKPAAHRSCHRKPYPGPQWCQAAWDSRPSWSRSSTWYIPEAWLREKLARIRSCESGGRYHIATGNGFYGAYQFMLSTWHSQGGRGYPHQNPPAVQDFYAAKLYRAAGPGPWPVCGYR